MNKETPEERIARLLQEGRKAFEIGLHIRIDCPYVFYSDRHYWCRGHAEARAEREKSNAD